MAIVPSQIAISQAVFAYILSFSVFASLAVEVEVGVVVILWFQCIYNNMLCVPQYELAVVTDDGVEIEGPLSLETNWEVAHYVR